MTNHDKASAASSAARAASRDIVELGQKLQGQTKQKVAARMAKLHQDRDAGMLPEPIPESEPEDDDEAMGFGNLVRGRAAKRDRASEPVLQKLKRFCIADAMTEIGIQDLEQQEHELHNLGAMKGEGTEMTGEPDEVSAPARRAKRAREDGKDPGPETSTAKDAKDGLLEKAKSLNGKKSSCSDVALWENKVKPRSLQAMSGQLEKMAEKLLATGKGPMKEMANSILAFTEDVKLKHNVFQEMRRDAPDWLQGPHAQETLDIFRKLPGSLLATIFTFLAKELLKTVDQASA